MVLPDKLSKPAVYYQRWTQTKKTLSAALADAPAPTVILNGRLFHYAIESRAKPATF
jgi:hypothetical protein